MTSEEQVAIVDNVDTVTGRMSKREAHVLGALHRTVIAEVIGSDKKMTLVKQAADRQDAGQLVSPVGGHVQAGETEEHALIREAKEEYGLDAPLSFRLIEKKIFNRAILGRKENHYFILYEIFTDQGPIVNKESVGIERFSKQELVKALSKNPKKFGHAFIFVVQTFYPELL